MGNAMNYITKGIGGFYYVKTPDGIKECKARGIFRKSGIKPVAGDWVELSPDGTVIDEIRSRKNVFVRPPVANLDVLFIVASTVQPVPSTLVLDQLAAAAIYKDVQPILVVTKADLGAADTLVHAYKTSGIPLVQLNYETGEGLDEIKAQIAEDAAGGKVAFFTRRYRKVILMAFCIAMFNQLSGINAILYYAPKVMKLAGGEQVLGPAFPYVASVIVGLMNLIATMAALTVIDKLGRRQLMIVGSIGYLISLGFLAGMMFAYEGRASVQNSAVPVWLILIGLLAFIASHAFGQGSVIWVFISEIFPNRVRARGQSLGSLTHWVFAFITTYAFPVLTDKLGGGYAFGIFFLAMVGQLFWVLKVMPETKGIPLEEMEEKLGLTND